MKFVFWQNIVSIHQNAFIKALCARGNDVTLVVQEELTPDRQADGWEVPDMGGANVIVAPGEKEMEALLADHEARQVFSGIDAYPMVYRAFKRAVAMGCDVSVMMEPYQWQGVKGALRRGKYMLHALRYGRSISRIFATGDLGVRAFRKAGFPKEKLFQWGYFTEQTEGTAKERKGLPRIIFVGSIDERKNILGLVEAATGNENLFSDFLIAGGGPLETELKERIAAHPKIHYLGRVKNTAVPDLLAASDLLVLPSRFDGWGAVVNEALGQGTRVLCSDACGAAAMLDGEFNGGTFKASSQESLNERLAYWLAKGPLSLDTRDEIRDWAAENISGERAARYFSEALSSLSADNQLFTPPHPASAGEGQGTDVIFVGRLDANKNAGSLIEAFIKSAGRGGQLTIVGDGELMQRFQGMSTGLPGIHLAGTLPNDVVRILIRNSDLLVLPSHYDGWGAVVNEALGEGTPVLCSDACGAGVLLDGEERGAVVPLFGLESALQSWMAKGRLTCSKREGIREWGVENISGLKAARYFQQAFESASPSRKIWQ